MAINDRLLDQLFSDLRPTYAGCREDYFGLQYLKQEFGLSTEQAASQVAFGGNDYGLDGFHVDTPRRNLYLYQFKWSTSYALFKQSFQRLIQSGMEMIFGNATIDRRANDLLPQLRSRLLEDQTLIERVCIHFVFNGDPAEAERSQVLDKLQEDLEGKKYLIDQWFGRPVSMICEFRSPSKRGSAGHIKTTHTYDIEITRTLGEVGPTGEQMTVGFLRLVDVHGMYREMGQRFFERNIRASLSEEEAPNRAILNALRQIVLNGKGSPAVFAFDHNGITLFAEKCEVQDGRVQITEPRLLNGAQTLSTFDRFLKANEGNNTLKQNNDRLRALQVLCKIITNASADFVVAVTINNNRQNPVMPWNLRANDLIQLALQDKFKDELGIYYERQENAFASLTQEDLEDLDITETRAIELLRLTKTLLAADGQIDKFSSIRDVFENDRIYSDVFSEARLRADSRHIVLCYKVQFRLNRIIREIRERGANKYYWISKARNLLWALLSQAILNDDRLDFYAERFGRGLAIEADYTDWIAKLASTRARILISDLVSRDPYAGLLREDRLSFLRTQAVYDKCMEQAYKKWHWTQKRLKQGGRGVSAAAGS